jgi:3',5'-cyclic AMP phosphodiesterase CpdA
MSTIAHLSDLHFGTEDPRVAEGLLEDVQRLEPELVVISGDLTQRAKSSEFLAARQFIDRLKMPTLIVPGNHDIPLYNLAARACWPLARYRRSICAELRPVFRDEHLLVLGIDTTRPSRWKSGQIHRADIEAMRSVFGAADGTRFKVLVTHHPFLPPHDDPTAQVVGRRDLALDVLEECGCELLLAGHLHRTYDGHTRTFRVKTKRSILVAQAGTALSNRQRGEPNAYNFITIVPNQLIVEVREWNGVEFAARHAKEFVLCEHQWSEIPN